MLVELLNTPTLVFFCFFWRGLVAFPVVPVLSFSFLSFAGRTGDGGTHLEGLKSIVTRTVNSMGRKSGKLKDSQSNLGGDFVREVYTTSWIDTP